MPATRTESNLSNALLERVEPRVVEQLPKRMLLLQLIERVAAKATGGGKSYHVVAERIVLIHDPNRCHTFLGHITERYCSNPCAIRAT